MLKFLYVVCILIALFAQQKKQMYLICTTDWMNQLRGGMYYSSHLPDNVSIMRLLIKYSGGD